VEILDRTFGQVRLNDSMKVEYVKQMMGEYFNLDRLLEKLGMELTKMGS
jgi:uncharacterized protein